MHERFDDLARALGSGLSRRETFRLLAGATLTAFFPRAAWGADCPPMDCPKKPATCEQFNKARCLTPKTYKGCFYFGTQQCYDHPNDIKQCSYTPTELTQNCPNTNPVCLEGGQTVLCCPKGTQVACQGQCCPPDQMKCCGEAEICCGFCDECKDDKCVRTRCTKVNSSGKQQICCPKPNGSVDCCDPDKQCCRAKGCEKKTAVENSRISEVAAAKAVQISVAVRDQRGIGTITPVELDNATLQIPPFSEGATEVVVLATKIDPTQRAAVQIQVCPVASCGCPQCCGLIDPAVAELRVPPGRTRVRESFAGVPASEPFVTVQNGSPGFRWVRLDVNGVRVGFLPLLPDQVQTVNVAPYMMGLENVVTVTGQGEPGSGALVLVSDLPAGDGKSTAWAAPPRVRWEPVARRPEVNLHWGR